MTNNTYYDYEAEYHTSTDYEICRRDFEPAFYKKLAQSEIIHEYEFPFDVAKIGLERWLKRHHGRDKVLQQNYLTDKQFLNFLKERQTFTVTVRKVVMSKDDPDSDFLVMEISSFHHKKLIIFAKKEIPFNIHITLRYKYVEDQKKISVLNRYCVQAGVLDLGCGILDVVNSKTKPKSYYGLPTKFLSNTSITVTTEDIKSPSPAVIKHKMHYLLNKLADIRYCLYDVYEKEDTFGAVLKVSQSKKFGFTSRLGSLDDFSVKHTFGNKLKHPIRYAVIRAISKHVFNYFGLSGENNFLIDRSDGDYIWCIYVAYFLRQALTPYQIQILYRFRAVFMQLDIDERLALVWLIKNQYSSNFKHSDFFYCMKLLLLKKEESNIPYKTFKFTTDKNLFFDEDNREMRELLSFCIYHINTKEEIKPVPPLIIRFFEQFNLNSFSRLEKHVRKLDMSKLLLSDGDYAKESLPFSKRNINSLLMIWRLQDIFSLKPFKDFDKEYQDVYGKNKLTGKAVRNLIKDYFDFVSFLNRRITPADGVSRWDNIPDPKGLKTLKNLHHDCEYWHQNFNEIEDVIRKIKSRSAEQEEFLAKVKVPDLYKTLDIPLSDSSGVSFYQMLSNDDFISESAKLHHCVAMYFEQSLYGGSYLFHLESDNELSTLELVLNKGKTEFSVVQHRGKYNSDVSTKHKNKADSIARELNKALKAYSGGDFGSVLAATHKEVTELYDIYLSLYGKKDRLSKEQVKQLHAIFPKFKLLKLYY